MSLRTLIARSGANSLDWVDEAFPDKILHLHSARPSGFSPRTPVLFVHHGVGRNGADYRDYWLDAAERHDLLVIAITCSEAHFPSYLHYHFGSLHNEDKSSNPPERWTYGFVPRLFDALRADGVTERMRYGQFGHSAGAQFIHRMLSFGYRDRVALAICANAGTYAMPDLTIPWPFGLGETIVTPESLIPLLTFPITVMAGTEDTKTTGRHFPGGPRSMRQGPTRYHRAHEYVRLGHEAAAALGTHCAWTVTDVPGVGHDGRGMSLAAAPVAAAVLHGPAGG